MRQIHSLIKHFKCSFLIFCSISFDCAYSSSSTNQLDSLLYKLPLCQGYTDSITTLRWISRLYRESDASQAISYTKMTINRAQKEKDTMTLVRMYEIYGHTLAVQGDYPMALTYFTKALSLLENKSDTLSNALRHHILAYKINFEQYDDSTLFKLKCAYLGKSIESFSRLSDHEGLSYAYYGLGQSYQHFANIFLGGTPYGPRARKLDLNMDLKKQRLLLSKAIQYYELALKESKIADLKDRTAACFTGMGRAYFHLGDTVKGLGFFRKAMAIHTKEGGLIGQAHCHLFYSRLALAHSNYDSAIYYGKACVDLFIKTQYHIETAMVMTYLSEIYTLKKDFPHALEYQKLAREYEHKSYNEQKLNATVEIANRYENQLKTSQIEKLEAEKKLAKAEQERNFYITTGLLVFSLVLGTVGVITLRFKEKSLKEARKNAELTQLLNKNLEQKTTEAELTAMRAQMNPHFVFNVMSSIQGLIISNKQKEAVEYLNEFSRLSRQTLEYSGKKFIPLKDEIAFLRNYLDLESLRFEHRFDITWDIDKTMDITSMEIPPMLIQPFVENAIKHGLLPKKDKGHLVIRIHSGTEEETLQVTIEDDGVGRKSKKENPSHASLGVAITEKRLDLFNQHIPDNRPYHISIIDLKDDSGNPVGTKVELSIAIINHHWV